MKHLPLWYLEQLHKDHVQAALNEFELLEKREASMGVNGDFNNQTQRNTTVAFGDLKSSITQQLVSFGMVANSECKWDYKIDRNEAVQYASYGIGQHYNWHTDTFTLSGKDTDRKVTVVCLLNDPLEFEGGEFQIRLYNEYVAPLKKGSIIAFPSIIEHRVTPVLRGIRKSATVWLSGPRMQ